MKKLLVLLTVMVAIFGFTAGAFSATVCEQCKCTLRNVPCTNPGQGTCSVNEFDYDLNTAADGYCTFSATNNCRLIFEICNCATSASFVPGLHVAVKMTILVNGAAGENGAYWSGGAIPAAITGQAETTYANACARAGTGLPLNFGAPTYFLSDGSTASAPLSGTACTVPAANRATIMTTASSVQTVLAGMGSYWRIDVPPIRIDPAVLHNNEIISVRVDIYDPTAATPICPVCVACLCTCEIQVAQVCCAGPTQATTLTFNYFTNLKSGDYWNGIAIANPSAAAGTCKLTAHEQDASVGTTTVTVPAGGLFVDLLENLTWAGTGLGGVPAYITASCNYSGAFGFGMMSNGIASMGYTVKP